jgi:hypothetical protein
LLQAICSSF